MASGLFVAYYRVSTKRQGASGLGLDAQRKSVTDFLNGGKWTVVAEFTEVESGKKDDRVELAKAIKTCRLTGARLVIAKLDRLSRDVHFLTGLQRAGVSFVAVDMPEANELVVQIMAAVAQAERNMISARTKAALAAAKARGAVLGGFRGHIFDTKAHADAKAARQEKAQARTADLAPVIAEIMATGATSLREIAAALNARSIRTARGGEWSATQVQRVIAATK